MKKKIELLSPAKNKETAFSAIDCGADAVYMGAPAFGARKAVPNSIEDIKEVIDYAHKFWAKVFITLNTILTDSELDDAVEIVKKLDMLGADAIIIQDLGLLKRLIELKLRIPVHMSTQCDNYLPQKVKFFNDIGVSRVILARECSIEQIKEIHRQNPNLELESFVHGALCVSMSGQCYLSQSIGGRSANRGECAQPCRKKYSVETVDGKVLKETIHALCLKDFNASKCLNELAESGIISFKIEGRLKDIGYVKNITAYYSNRMKNRTSSGKSVYPFIPNPEKSFNRGFTEYFLKGRTDCFNFESPKSRGEYLGTVVKVDNQWFKLSSPKNIYPHPQDGIYFNGEGFLINKVEGGKIYPNRAIDLKVGTKLYRNFDSEFEKQILQPTKRQIGVNIEVNKGKIYLVDEDSVSMEMDLTGDAPQNKEKAQETFVKQISKTGESDFYISDIKISPNTEIPFMPVSQINSLRRELFEELMNKRLKTYLKQRQVQKEMNYVPYYQQEVDYRANVMNKEAEEFYKNCNCRVNEYALEKSKPNRQTPLMRCKHCIKYALNMCKSPEKLVLKDEFRNKYPLIFDCKNCEMSVMSK